MQDYKSIPDGTEGELPDDTSVAYLVNTSYLESKAFTPDSLSVAAHLQSQSTSHPEVFDDDTWVIRLSPNESKNIYVLPDLAVPKIDNVRTMIPEASINYIVVSQLVKGYDGLYYVLPLEYSAPDPLQIKDSTSTSIAEENGWAVSTKYGGANYWEIPLHSNEGAEVPFFGVRAGLFFVGVGGMPIDFYESGDTKSKTNQKDAGRYLITTRDPTTERRVKWGNDWINKVDPVGTNVVKVNGNLGDVTMVDIPALVKDQLPKSLGDIGLGDFKKAKIEYGTLDPKDTVYQDGTWEKEGKFYFHPELSGTPYAEDHSHVGGPGLQGGSLKITDGDPSTPDDDTNTLTVEFNITDDFSGANSDNAVKWDASKLDKLRIEQRLSYFGYPDENGDPLTVDGKGDDLLWAGQLFGSAAAGLAKKITTVLDKGLGPTGAAFINADNAPRWTEVAGVKDGRPFKVKDGANQTERWGTNWAVDWLTAAAAKSSGYSEVLNGLSIKEGGKNTHKGHQTGIDIDIDTPGLEVLASVPHGSLFFKEVKLKKSSSWVLAADSAGETVWVDVAGTYVSKPKKDVLSSDKYIKTNAITKTNLDLWENLLRDNSSVGYKHETIEKLIPDYIALSVSDVTEKVVYFDDPRIYNHIAGVKFQPSHLGHIHVEISPPTAKAHEAKAASASLEQADVGNIDGPLTATSLREEAALGMPAPSLGALQDLGLAPAAAIAGSIDSVHPDRYYGFSLSGFNPAFSGDEVGYYELPRVVTLGLTNTSANLDFEIGMDDNNDGTLQADEIIFVSTGTSKTSEELTTPFALDEGDYLVHIHGATGNANSSFALNVGLQALSGSPVDAVGNTPASAKALVLGPQSTRLSEYLSPEDRADYYRITVTEPSHLGLTLHGLKGGNAVSTLAIDTNGDGIVQDEEIIDSIITEPGEATKLDQDLFQPGTYLLAMEQYSGATGYTIDALLDPPNIGTDTAFHALDYIASYGDLMNWLGTNKSTGFDHYVHHGYYEGRSTTFNGAEYIASYADLMNWLGADIDKGAAHYITGGRFEGRTISFNGLEYIASYGDLVKALGADPYAGAEHYIRNGRGEGRVVSFDSLDYIASYPDLINWLGTDTDKGAAHYITNGHSEGRSITFDGLNYIASYPDLINWLGTDTDKGAAHYITNGHSEGRSITFDGLNYIASYPDLINWLDEAATRRKRRRCRRVEVKM